MLTAAIIYSLLNWIELNTNYNTKNFKTKIVEVSKKEIQKIACGGKCPIIAFYKPEEVKKLKMYLKRKKLIYCKTNFY